MFRQCCVEVFVTSSSLGDLIDAVHAVASAPIHDHDRWQCGNVVTIARPTIRDRNRPVARPTLATIRVSSQRDVSVDVDFCVDGHAACARITATHAATAEREVSLAHYLADTTSKALTANGVAHSQVVTSQPVSPSSSSPAGCPRR